MAELKRFAIVSFGPYRFMGKTVYAPPGSGEIFGALWGDSAEIFSQLDALSEYATQESHNVAYMNWDSSKNLLGYTVGRFMKADAPVPDGLDALEIPAQLVAEAWVEGEFNDMISDAPNLTEKAIASQEDYEINWSEAFVGAEVYSKETIAEDGVYSVLGYYIPCRKKS